MSEFLEENFYHNFPGGLQFLCQFQVDDDAPQLVGITGDVLTITIEVDENSLVTLSPEVLKATDPDTDDLLLTFKLELAPYEGVLLREGQQTTHFTQADLQAGRIQYRHTGGEVGPVGRNDSFSLMLTDGKNGFVLSGNRIDTVQVKVLILPVDSEPPYVTVGAPFQVLESDKATILPRHLDATDIDTDVRNIVCMIVAQAKYGYLENVSPAPGSEKPRVGIPISSFTIRDVRMGVVNYVQSVHKGLEPLEDRFSFQCSDGRNFSPDFVFSVQIYPTNDEEPVVSLREFMVVSVMTLFVFLARTTCSRADCSGFKRNCLALVIECVNELID